MSPGNHQRSIPGIKDANKCVTTFNEKDNSPQSVALASALSFHCLMPVSHSVLSHCDPESE